jgi:DNA gyrase subunit B
MLVESIESVVLEGEIEVFDLGVKTYHNFKLACGAFVHNSHIVCLFGGHMLRHYRPLIERGYVYVGQPPLYRVTEGKKVSWMADDRALKDFYTARAGKAGAALLSSDGKVLTAASRALASGAMALRKAIETAAAEHGFPAEDVSHAIRLLKGPTREGGDPVASLAEAIMERREAEGCENVAGEEVSLGVFVISGLAAGRYFTTVVNSDFRNACEAADSAACGAIGAEAVREAAGAVSLRIGTVCGPADLLSAAKAVESEARRGTSITRMKGLGEMTDMELGETTLDRKTRRLVRMAVTDFDSTGSFVGSMLSKGDRYVEARREAARGSLLSADLVDA